MVVVPRARVGCRSLSMGLVVLYIIVRTLVMVVVVAWVVVVAVRGGMDIATSRPASTLWDVSVEAA
eukprot:COSAG04_NODE_25129_length_311_cov_1.415094_1_plen_65_part_01